MGRKFLIFLLIFFAGIIQISLLPHFFPSYADGNLMLVIVVFWSFRKNFYAIWPRAAAAGLVLDFLALGKIGISAVSFSAVSLGCCFLAQRFFSSRKTGAFFFLAGLVIIGTAINFLVSNILLTVFSNPSFSIFSGKAMGGLAFGAISNLIIFSIIYPFANKRVS